MTRFLVRRRTGDVYIWTEVLARRRDLEEVFAEDAKQALEREALPDPRQISLDQLEKMLKADLILFAKIKLKLELPQEKDKDILLDMVKEAVFTRSPAVQEETPTGPVLESRAFNNVNDIRQAGARGHAGDQAKIEGTHESPGADQSVRR